MTPEEFDLIVARIFAWLGTLDWRQVVAQTIAMSIAGLFLAMCAQAG